jgi:hypothetical protein
LQQIVLVFGAEASGRVVMLRVLVSRAACPGCRDRHIEDVPVTHPGYEAEFF